MKHPSLYKTGLDISNAANIDPFELSHKSEVIQLKGELLLRSGQVEAADKAFATAIAMNKNNENAWRNWGKVWDAQYINGTFFFSLFYISFSQVS